MIMKLLGVADLIIALLFFLNNTFDKSDAWLPNSIILWAGIVLLVKGIFFLIFLDFASIIDIVCGLIIILSAFMSIYWLLAFLVAVFLVQKGLISIVA